MYDHMLTQLEALHQKRNYLWFLVKNGCIKKKLKDFKDRTFIFRSDRIR